MNAQGGDGGYRCTCGELNGRGPPPPDVLLVDGWSRGGGEGEMLDRSMGLASCWAVKEKGGRGREEPMAAVADCSDDAAVSVVGHEDEDAEDSHGEGSANSDSEDDDDGAADEDDGREDSDDSETDIGSPDDCGRREADDDDDSDEAGD